MKHLFHLILKRFGLRVNRIGNTNSGNISAKLNMLQEFILELQAAGFRPKMIMDIGANRGAWTRSIRRVFPDAHYLLIEPQAHLRPHVQDLLDDPLVELRNCAVSNYCGKASFHVSDWDVTSSLATVKPDGNGNIIEVDVLTIDSIVQESRGAAPSLIKIDAEGFDLEVLGGASSVFGTTEVFLVEAAVCCPSMRNDVSSIIKFMEEAGYHLAAIADINTYQWPPDHHSPGLQWLVDLAFLRKDGPLLQKLQYPEADTTRIAPF